MIAGEAIKPSESLWTIRLFQDDGGCWNGDVTDCVGRRLASASALVFWAVWDMLASVLERELPYGERGES